jgi:hypothetical protein
MEKYALLDFVDLMESSHDDEKMRAFVRMNPNERAAYLYNFRACAHSDEISLRKKSTLLNIERKLAQVDRECRAAGR